MFEAKKVCTGIKRKRLEKGDPSDVDGYEGPWRGYVDQVKVSKPTEKQLALLEEQLGERKKKKQVKDKEETIDESSMLHGECRVVLCVCLCSPHHSVQLITRTTTWAAPTCTSLRMRMWTCVQMNHRTSVMLPRNSFTLGESPCALSISVAYEWS